MLNIISNRKGLKWLFLLFFLALVIPSLMLSWKAFDQLRWEALINYQEEAASLTRQINEQLKSAIEKEENRADADYEFFRVSGDPSLGYLQPSELSKYPVESDLQGVIGYFQVDSNGQFSSPLVPEKDVNVPQFRLAENEKIVRNQLVHYIRSILQENQLVSDSRSSQERLAEFERKREQAEKKAKQSNRAMNDSVDDKAELAESLSRRVAAEESSAKSDSDEEADNYDSIVVTGSRVKRTDTRSSAGLSQEGFSKLQAPEVQSKISQDYSSNRQLSKLNSRKTADEALKKKKAKMPSPAKSRRLEQNYIPQKKQIALDKVLEAEASSPTESGPERGHEQNHIELFSSEVESFRFSLLRSGHLVAYRQVWRQGERIIQGAVLDADKFFKETVYNLWITSNLSQVSSLHIGYADSILQRYKGENVYQKFSSRENSLRGKELYFTNLDEPFGQVSLLFTIKDIPIGAGATFILMVTFSLISVLVIGTFLLYRLAVRQLNMAQQQQDFVSSVSHELKTPLTSIRMYGEILKQGWMDEDKKQEYYDYIYNESERLSRLIANILQLSKVNHNALELNLKMVKVSTLINLIHSKIDRQIEQSEFEVEFDVAESVESISIAVEEDAFTQIIINLVDNAIKYARNSENKRIIIGAMEEGSLVEFYVRDFGPGIDKKQRKKIFEPFYRIGDEMTRESKGTGIGLALVKELATEMKATIDVNNKEPGAEFIVKFPKADN